MTIEPDDISAIAGEYGLTLSQEQAEAYAADATDSVEQYRELDGTPEPTPAASDVRPGDDEHNAFRCLFELDGGTGPLSDLSIATKENVCVAGVEMTCGSDAFAFTPGYSATVIERLRTAGAAVVGTTNMDEFALFPTGETCAHGEIANPAVPDRVPGGSSGGSGAAVAAGAVDAALGSDTAGSIRIPASFCGVVGLKPTHRTVPRFGFVDLAPSLDHVGPLAADVETAARVFDAIAGPDPADPSTLTVRPDENTAAAVDGSVDDLRVGLVEDAFAVSADPVAETVREAVAALPVETETVELPTIESLFALSAILGPEFVSLVANAGQVYGTGTGYSEPYRAALAGMDPDGLGENVRDSLMEGAAVTTHTDGASYVGGQAFRRSFVDEVAAAFTSVDALVTPTTPKTALEFGAIQTSDDLINAVGNTGPWNLTGHPALSVPCSEAEGRPVGVQVVTEHHDESTAIRIGSAIEGRSPTS